MKVPANFGGMRARGARAFTLVEMLVVIAVIAILAGMLLPALGKMKVRAQVARTKNEIQQLEQAIIAFKSTYSIWPMDSAVRSAGTPDYTYGTAGVLAPDGFPYQGQEPVVNNFNSGLQTNNAAIMYILMAQANATHNPNHINNPQKKQLVNVKMASGEGLPGWGPTDGVYRDVWKNPYIISIDADYDNLTFDGFYCRTNVSQRLATDVNGINGLFSKSSLSNPNDFVYRGGVMVWSKGPDGKSDPSIPADEGVNADNVLSWK